jgi:hypothetical protein
LSSPRDYSSAGLALTAFFVWTFVFWWSGVRHAERPKTYLEACSRFDRGLTWLFALLFMKLLLRGQAGVPASDGLSDSLVMPFFVGGVVSIALARNRGSAHRNFVRGYRGVGLVSGFAATLMLCSAGCALLVLPFLRTASATGYHELTTIGRPMADAAAMALLAVVGLARYLPPPQIYRGGAPSMVRGQPDSALRPEDVVPNPSSTGSWLLLGLTVTIVVALGAWYLRRRLLSRDRGPDRDASVFEPLRQWLARLARLVARWLERRQQHEALRLYRALVSWGRRNGSPKRPSETPIEYGRRLKQQLHGVSAEIDLVVAAFNAHVYGHASFDRLSLNHARRALRRLRSPLLWPKRLRLWFLSEGAYGTSPSPRTSQLSPELVGRDTEGGR